MDYNRNKKYFEQHLSTAPIIVSAACIAIGFLMVVILSGTRGFNTYMMISGGLTFIAIGAAIFLVRSAKKIPDAEISEQARKLYDTYRPDVVVVTQGKRGGIMFDGEKITAYPVYPADVVDSNGSGDVFHGAFAAGILKGFDFEKCCHFSSAVSALKCMGVGARESVPDFQTVKKYMEEHHYEL